MFILSLLLHCIHSISFSTRDVVTCGYRICQGKYMGNFDQLLLALASLCCNGFLGDGDGISSKSAEVARISGVEKLNGYMIYAWYLEVPKPLQHIDILYLYESHFIGLAKADKILQDFIISTYAHQMFTLSPGFTILLPMLHSWGGLQKIDPWITSYRGVIMSYVFMTMLRFRAAILVKTGMVLLTLGPLITGLYYILCLEAMRRQKYRVVCFKHETSKAKHTCLWHFMSIYDHICVYM